MGMKFLLLALLPALPAWANDSPPAASPANPAASIKSAIDRDWIARTEASGSVMVQSPAYALRSGRGCVIHWMYFPAYDGHPSPGEMIAGDRFYVFASGEECGAVDPKLFFGIEPGNDVAALLDFGARLKVGPQVGKDHVEDRVLARIAPCFDPGAIATTRIAHAHSWRPEGSRQDRYQVTLDCKLLEEEGQIVATGARGEEAVAWEFRNWNQRAIDAPAPLRG